MGDAQHRVVANADLELAAAGGKRLEQRLRQPGLHERLHPVALRALREPLVGGAAGLAGRWAGDAGRGADQDEAFDDRWAVQREAQAEAPTERVPDPGRRAASDAERVGGRDEVQPIGQLDRLDIPVGWQARHDGVPRSAGLGEAMDQADPHAWILP